PNCSRPKLLITRVGLTAGYHLLSQGVVFLPAGGGPLAALASLAIFVPPDAVPVNAAQSMSNTSVRQRLRHGDWRLDAYRDRTVVKASS
ncbi:MAG: hypothetical protein R6U98_05270, partial [Pirellulaceae bacterium]